MALTRRTWFVALLGAALVATSAGAARAAGQVRLAEVGAPAPDATFTDIDGRTHQLSDYRGRRVMLWIVATWCPTCRASAQVLAERAAEIEAKGLVVITLEVYRNLGYEGPDMRSFVRTYAPTLLGREGWIWGEAGFEASMAYDPKGYPDIYWLIDERGIVRAMDTAPNVTLGRILAFAAAAGGRSG